MALGALSTLATFPVYERAGSPEAQAGTTRSDVAAWLSALSLAGLGRPAGAHPGWERDATSVARSWLRLVDDGRHPASWAAAAPLLRAEVGPSEWDAALGAARAPLGRCLWRRLLSRAVVEGPPGPRQGPYVVIRFESLFARGKGAVETITPVLGPDGRWRVAAYFLG
jgi:hypothetical protein